MGHKDIQGLEGFRERLKSRTLTDEDVEYLEWLLEAQQLGTIAGRPGVARLPPGMDVIK